MRIHVRVIVNAGGFVTIATALQSFFLPEGASGGKLLNLRSGCEFDCFGLCSFGFAGCRGAGGLRNLYGDVWGFPDACSATGGGKRVQARGGTAAGGEELVFLQVLGRVFIGARRQAAPFFYAEKTIVAGSAAAAVAAVGAGAATARRSAAGS